MKNARRTEAGAFCRLRIFARKEVIPVVLIALSLLGTTLASGYEYAPFDSRRLTFGALSQSSAQLRPDLTVDGLNLTVVWVDSREGQDDIYFVRSTDFGATWSDERKLADVDEPVRGLEVIASSGIVRVVYSTEAGMSEFVSVDGTTHWTKRQMPFSATEFDCAVDAEFLHLVWTSRDASVLSYARSQLGGSEWSSPETLASLTQTVHGISVVADDGLVSVVSSAGYMGGALGRGWETNNSVTGFDVAAAGGTVYVLGPADAGLVTLWRSIDRGSHWTEVTSMPQISLNPTESARIGANDEDVLVTFSQTDASGTEARAFRILGQDHGTLWSAAHQVSVSTRSYPNPDLVPANPAFFFMLWEDGDLYLGTLGQLVVLPPPITDPPGSDDAGRFPEVWIVILILTLSAALGILLTLRAREVRRRFRKGGRSKPRTIPKG